MNSPSLQGGRRRRRSPLRGLAFLLLVLTPFAIAAVAYVSLRRDDGDTRIRASAAQIEAPASAEAVLEPPPPPRIRLSSVDAFRLRMRKPPRGALLFDLSSGDALWSHRPRQRLPIASLTKVMTALLVTERAGPDERVRVTREVTKTPGSGIGVLPKGRRVRFEALLNGLILVSGNDAAVAMAQHVAGSTRRFVGLMNRRARALGLRCTHFVDPHGLSNGNRSCARDLAVLTRLAMGNRRIARVARRHRIAMPFPIKGRRLFLSGHNPLLRENYPGAIGLKTGYTQAAGRCFIGVARRGRRTLGVVLLNSPNPPRHAPRLLDEGFRS